MALWKRQKTKQKQAYLDYYKGGGRLTYAQWVRQGKPTVRTTAITKELEVGGLSKEDIAKLRRGK